MFMTLDDLDQTSAALITPMLAQNTLPKANWCANLDSPAHHFQRGAQSIGKMPVILFKISA